MIRRQHRRILWEALWLVTAMAAMFLGQALYERGLPGGFPVLDDYGTLQALDPAQETQYTAPVDVRTGCRIAVFGVAPWLKPGKPKDAAWERRTRKALSAMGLPEQAMGQTIERMRAGRADDALGMGNVDGIATASGQTYLPSFSTTYMQGQRGVACHDSQTRFVSDYRREYAVVYRVAHAGTVYHLGEFLACGNVSRFFPAPPGWAGSAPQASIPGSSQSDAAAISQRRSGAAAVTTHETPEPGTLALLGIAIACMGFPGKRQKGTK